MNLWISAGEKAEIGCQDVPVQTYIAPSVRSKYIAPTAMGLPWMSVVGGIGKASRENRCMATISLIPSSAVLWDHHRLDQWSPVTAMTASMLGGMVSGICSAHAMP